MPIIQNSVFQGASDRLAKQVQLILAGVNNAAPSGGGEHFQRVTVPGDYDVENDLIDSSYAWDKNLSGSNIFSDIGKLSDYITALHNHSVNRGAQDLDRFLQTSGIDVADYFADAYFWIRGSRLSGRNVFYTGVLDPMGTLDVITSGTGTFTDGYDLGTGSGNYVGRDIVADLETAAEHLVAYVPSGISIGSNGLGVRWTCEKQDGTTETKDTTFSASAPAGTALDIGATTDLYIDITNAQILTGSNASDQVKAKSTPLRTIAL